MSCVVTGKHLAGVLYFTIYFPGEEGREGGFGKLSIKTIVLGKILTYQKRGRGKIYKLYGHVRPLAVS